MGKALNIENQIISAKDDAYFFHAMSGKNGIFPYGNRMDHELINNNKITIKDGIIQCQGRNYIIYPNEVDNLTIESGTQSQKRNDLIVYEVSKTSEGESLSLKVLKGESGATAIDPTLTQQDTLVSGATFQLPLYRIRLDGINIDGVDDLRTYINTQGNSLQAENIVNNLSTTDSGKVLDARQGKALNDKINTLQIGCRNLVKNSDANLTGARLWNANMSFLTHTFYKGGKAKMFCIQNATTSEKTVSSERFDIEGGKTYTLSFYGFMSGNVSNIDVFVLGRKKSQTNDFTYDQLILDKKRLSTDKVQYVTVTFTAKSGMEEAYLRFDNNGTTDSNNSKFFFNEVKLECGEKATDYTISNESTVEHGHNKVLWSGTLSSGKSVTLADDSFLNYSLFGAQTSDGWTMLLGLKLEVDGTYVIRMVGGSDSGSNSIVFKANLQITKSSRSMNLIACSKHSLLSTGCQGTALQLTSLIGIV